MSGHPIRRALEHLEEQASPPFRDALRIRFLAEIQQPNTATAADDTVRVEGSADREEIIMVAIEESPQREAKQSRRRAVLGIAASIIVVAGLIVVVVNHRSDTASVDTSHDPEIAEDALVGVDELGSGYLETNARSAWTSRAVAAVAETIDACAPYVDYAFDSPTRGAETAGKVFETPKLYWMTQWVYLFPTEAAASKAMDKISEDGFALCLNQLREKMYNDNPRGAPTTVTTVDAPPMLSHGDRQVVLGQFGTFGSYGNLTFTIMNVFVQVGRGIVYVDPITDFHQSDDPAGSLEIAASTATQHLKTALASAAKG
jgi:hypothetical protein